MKKLKVISLIILTVFLCLIVFLRANLKNSDDAYKFEQSVNKSLNNALTDVTRYDSIENLRYKTLINNKDVKINKLNHDVYIVNYWATWCLPCQVEIPHLKNIVRIYKNKVKVIGISKDKNVRLVTQYLKQNKLPYDIVMNSVDIEQNFGPITSVPQTLFYDKDYNLIHKKKGYTSLETLTDTVESMLN